MVNEGGEYEVHGLLTICHKRDRSKRGPPGGSSRRCCCNARLVSAAHAVAQFVTVASTVADIAREHDWTTADCTGTAPRPDQRQGIATSCRLCSLSDCEPFSFRVLEASPRHYPSPYLSQQESCLASSGWAEEAFQVQCPQVLNTIERPI